MLNHSFYIGQLFLHLYSQAVSLTSTKITEGKFWVFFYRIQVVSSVQFSSVTQSCPTLCDPMNHSTPDLSVHHHLPEFTQTHIHRVGDAIHPSHPLSSPPSIRVFSNESTLHLRWPKYWSFSFSIIPSKEHTGLISFRIAAAAAAAAAAAKSLQSCPTLGNPMDGSPLGSSVPGILQARTLEWVAISFSTFRMDWLDFLAVQGTLKSSPTPQFKSINSLVLSFFTGQLSHPNMTTGKTIALTKQTFVGKVISLLFNMISSLVITFLPRSKCLLI